MKNSKLLFYLLFSAISVYSQPVSNLKNSWVGNTFGLPDMHIPHNTDNMYVTPSGKVAIITGWDEGGHNVKVFDTNGIQLCAPEQSGTGSWGRGSGSQVFLDDNYIYQVFKQHGCDGGNGLDINPGTISQPWKTLATITSYQANLASRDQVFSSHQGLRYETLRFETRRVLKKTQC